MATKVKGFISIKSAKKAKLNVWHSLPQQSMMAWIGEYLVANMVVNAMCKQKKDTEEVPIAFKIVKISEKTGTITYNVAYRGDKI